MRYIPRPQQLPSDEWIQRANDLTARLRNAQSEDERNDIIDANEIWRELRDSLLELSYGKCWYSEAREAYSYYHVDHFRPKKEALNIEGADCGGYWWLTYEWNNYRVCGAVGNTIKRSQFCVLRHKANNPADPIQDEQILLLDPTKTLDPAMLTFDETGFVKPSYTNGLQQRKAEYSIKILKLNYELLVEARKSLWLHVARSVAEIQQLFVELDQTQSVVTEARIRAKAEELQRMKADDAEFSAMVTVCLLSFGITWAARL